MEISQSHSSSYLSPLIAGGLAGLAVDVALYPIDTIKTRVQSQQGFYKSGGFRGIYSGLSAVVTGSVPTSALFFASYELVKQAAEPRVSQHYTPAVHMLAASVGEVMACLIRVPTEVVKQRKQSIRGAAARSGVEMLATAFRDEGLAKGVYRGFFSTVLRDLPFSFIQMPIWELLKSQVRARNDGKINSFQGAYCGSIAGGISAAITTPLDVAKTRIMLSPTPPGGVRSVLKSVYSESGMRGVFAGLTARVVAFTIGGFVFFGAYESFKETCDVFL